MQMTQTMQVADLIETLEQARTTASWYEPAAFVHRDMVDSETAQNRKVCVYAFESEVANESALESAVDSLSGSVSSVRYVVFPDALSSVVRDCADIVVSDLEWAVKGPHNIEPEELVEAAYILQARHEDSTIDA